MTQDIRDLIAESREAAVRSALWDIPDLLFRLVDALEASLGVPPTCSDHRLVQHRDGKPPWCRACDGGDDE